MADFWRGFAQTFNPQQIIQPLIQQEAEDRRWAKLEEQRKLDQQDKLDEIAYKENLEREKETLDQKSAEEYLNYAKQVNEYYNSEVPDALSPEEVEKQKALFSPEIVQKMNQTYLSLKPSTATRVNELLEKQTGGSWRVFPELESAVKVLENGSIIYSDKIKGLREALDRKVTHTVTEDSGVGDGTVNLVEFLANGEKRIVATYKPPKGSSTKTEKANPLGTKEGLESFNIKREEELQSLRKNIDAYTAMRGDDYTDPAMLQLLAKYRDPIALKYRDIVNTTMSNATDKQKEKLVAIDRILEKTYKLNLDKINDTDYIVKTGTIDPKKRKEAYNAIVKKLTDNYPEEYDPESAQEMAMIKNYLKARLQIIYN